MTKNLSWPLLIIPGVFAVLSGAAISAQDKYSVRVPGGLSLSECRGYEDWPAVAVSHPEDKINVIIANPTMIDAYRASTGWPRGCSCLISLRCHANLPDATMKIFQRDTSAA